jgi:hypothetical protein
MDKTLLIRAFETFFRLASALRPLALAVLDECERTLNSSKYIPTLNGLPSLKKIDGRAKGKRAKEQRAKKSWGERTTPENRKCR